MPPQIGRAWWNYQLTVFLCFGIIIWVKLRYSSLGSYLNSNTLNLNILGKDNIVCVSLVNITMCLNSIGELNVPNLRNCI